MLPFLHTLSAALFYLLAGSFFAAYLLIRNNLFESAAHTWMQTGDLPLLLVGILFGGISIYRSLTSDASASRILLIAVSVPLTLFFLAILYVNFV
jgi:hypothetical protein